MNENARPKLFEHQAHLSEKLSALREVVAQLKAEFCGIDGVIDRFARLMEPWLIMASTQMRPLIINLWGMTGTGKTSLVRRASSLLDVPLIQIDLGEYSSRQNFSREFYDRYSLYSGQPVVVLLDEIQNPRTVDEHGNEVDREGLRGMWSLLSDGIIVPDISLEKLHYIFRLERAIEQWDYYGGVAPSSKRQRRPWWKRFRFNVTAEDEADEKVDEMESPQEPRRLDAPWKLDHWLVTEVLQATGRGGRLAEIKEALRADWRTTAALVLSWARAIDPQPKLDFKEALIVVTGNVDEVYTAALSTDPDITPDKLHKWSKKITVPDVKQSLLKRYRPEQVGRLGSNHILYPALDGAAFRQIIANELNTIQNSIRQRFDVNIQFGPSVHSLVYREGVFATQGARSVLTTVVALVSTSIPSCLTALLKRSDDSLVAPIPVRMELNGETKKAEFYLDGELLTTLDIELSIESLREPRYDDLHIVTAIHEAGHALCEYLFTGRLPVKVSAFSASADALGVTEGAGREGQPGTKAYLMGTITAGLGGWAAEAELLREDLRTSASADDLEKITAFALDMVRRYGLGREGNISNTKNPTINDPYYLPATAEDDENVRQIVADAQGRARAAIRTHRIAVLSLATELLSVSKLETAELRSIFEREGIRPNSAVTMREEFEGLLVATEIDWAPPASKHG